MIRLLMNKNVLKFGGLLVWTLLACYIGYSLSGKKHLEIENTKLKQEILLINKNKTELENTIQQNEIKYQERISKLRNITCNNKDEFYKQVELIRKEIVKLTGVDNDNK